MIDIKIIKNYVALRLISLNEIPIKSKKEPYGIYVVNGQPLPESGGMTHETHPITLHNRKYTERAITFDVLNMATHDVILGMPWLRKNNPRID